MVLDGTGSVYDDTGWYLVSISWYCLILGGTWSAKGLYACIYWKKLRFGRVTPMPHTLTHSQTSEYRATQLVSSIKHKLSHAIAAILWVCDNDDAKESTWDEDALLMMSFSTDVIEMLRSLHAIMWENGNDDVEAASTWANPLNLYLCVITMMPFDLNNDDDVEKSAWDNVCHCTGANKCDYLLDLNLPGTVYTALKHNLNFSKSTLQQKWTRVDTGQCTWGHNSADA